MDVLTAGTKLGPYEIVAPLGAGGMGEVYRARDTKLNRDVAIKVLLPTVANDPDRLARFSREAQVLASLNHPNIAHIHGLEEADGVTALVLELVEGEDLAQRIARGSIPIDEALPIAKQIADALEAAHEQGIVHRDLKPANIKVRPDGTVKILDFGLAKAVDPAGASSANAMNSPTISMHATQAGIILGTAAYMSPEQARGKVVDKRTDIWAFGCVLIEMLTGTRAFAGDDVTDTIVSVVSKEPDWSALPPGLPVGIRRLLRRCLDKDPKRRLDSAAAVRIEIDEALIAPPTDDSTAAQAGTALPSTWSRVLPWVLVAAACAALIASLFTSSPWRATPARAVIRLEAGIGADGSLVTDQGPAAAISLDGALVAFVAQKGAGAPQLLVRRVDHLDAAALAGTDNARNPFFSPDGQSIGFFADGKLKKVSAAGGATVTLCDAPNGRGASWADDGTIVFQPSNIGAGTDLGAVLLSVSSAGGQPHPLTIRQEGEANQRWPQVLPGGRAVLYTAPNAVGSFADSSISVQLLPSRARKILVHGGYSGRYLQSGHLVYLHDGTLFAVPFNLERLEVTGPAVPALEHVAVNPTLGAAQFSVSNNGTVVYLSGEDLTATLPITWLNRDGTTSALRAMPSDWSNVAFSPDGRRLALDIGGQRFDIWTYDWARDALQRLTVDAGSHQSPMWTPDGRRVAFSTGGTTGAASNLFWIAADGAGSPERLTTSANSQWAGSWHPSGKYLAYTEANPHTSHDIMILPFDGDESSGWKPGKPSAFLNSPFAEFEPTFSPDGRWLAYSSAENGRNEVFVRPFPGPGGKWQISADGGIHPTWSRTRKELFYLSPDQHIVVVSYAVNGDSFGADRPRNWAEARLAVRPRGTAAVNGRSFDLSPDGERFAVALAPQIADTKRDKVVFVFNFFDELRRIAPGAKR